MFLPCRAGDDGVLAREPARTAADAVRAIHTIRVHLHHVSDLDPALADGGAHHIVARYDATCKRYASFLIRSKNPSLSLGGFSGASQNGVKCGGSHNFNQRMGW